MSILNFTPAPERRRERSKQACQAITLQLRCILEGEGLRNFTLGDSRGLVIASAGHGDESEVMAAYAPMIANYHARGRKNTVFEKVRQFVPGVFDETCQVKTFEVDGETLYLTLLGAPGVYQHVCVYRAVTGVRRILRQNAAA